jgi:hypothetical protein
MSYKALNPPPLVRDKPADEVMRAAVLNGELHVSLRLGFNEPAVWGQLFVDAARHVARIYAHEKLMSEEAALERIRESFEKTIREPPEGTSGTTEIRDTP